MDVEKCTRDLRETVRELEAALATTRETMQQLKGALESREDEIVGLRQMLTSTKKERDELRVQNAELIHRLAVIGRKQSTSSPPWQSRSTPPPESPSTQSPVLQRRNSKIGSPLPPLPPPPPADSSQPPATDPVAAAATDEGSDTEYSDMEGDEVTEKKTEGRKRRSKSPKSPTKGDPGSQQKFSRPKPIVRSLPKSTTTAESSGTTAKLTSPKKSVTFNPARNMLSISEEEGGASPEQARMMVTVQVTTVGERTPSDGGVEGSPVFGGVGGNVGTEETSQLRRRITMSMSDFKKKSPSQELPSEDAAETDTGGQPTKYDHLEMRRSRTSTISSTCGGSYKKEYKRKNSKQLKEAAAKLERSPDFISGGRKLHRLELFSPDMELRIRETICSEIGKKYGGLTRANKSAIVIQSAYRQYKLREQYNKIRKEASEVRKRAQSMRDPRRRPSMIRKKHPGRYYNRNLSALAPTTDPLLKTKLLSQDIGRAGVPHTHTSSRRQLVEKTRSEQSLSEGRQSAEPASSPTQETEDGAVEMEVAVCEIELEDEATPTVRIDVAADGATVESTDSLSLPTSFSTDVLLTSAGYTRPVSIFSPARPSSSIETTSLGQQRISRGDDEDVTMSRRPLSPEVRNRKINMGIGHFNRKPTRGIQYLVRENVLTDSPQKVATFLANQYGLSKEKIGEFVGEISSEFHMAVLECLLEQMDMKSKPIDEALRDFQILFRMPGEAQKIDKIMQMFALEYYRFNKERVIKSEDAAYILSFAIMMLHTSLHNPSVKSRTTKKQWVSMNRGCSDGENFPEQFLLEIYDRIGKREFTTGQDHTTEVSDIERNLVGYQNTSRLAIPQRRLICRAVVTEIDQLTSRPSFKNKRRRLVLVFSDQVIICKKRGGDQLEYRGSFSLMDAIAISFETHHYRNGIQIHSSHDAKAIFQCNCDTGDERVKLLGTLEATISELRDMEKERIAELGSSVSKSQDVVPDRRHRMASRAGDLMSSAQLEKPLSSRESKGDYVQGVGDLVISSSTKIIRRTSRSSGSSSQPENRTSGGSHESGYDSQRTTPVPSPSPTNPPHSTPNYSAPSVAHPTPPSVKRQLQPRISTASAPMTLMTPGAPVTRSKSTDQINLVRVMTITPTLKSDARGKYSSAEDVRGSPKSSRHSASYSPRLTKKKKERTKTTSGERKKLNFSPFRRSNNSNNSRRGSSPVPGTGGSPVVLTELTRSRAVSETPSPHPQSDLELSTRSAASTYLVVNTT